MLITCVCSFMHAHAYSKHSQCIHTAQRYTQCMYKTLNYGSECSVYTKYEALTLLYVVCCPWTSLCLCAHVVFQLHQPASSTCACMHEVYTVYPGGTSHVSKPCMQWAAWAPSCSSGIKRCKFYRSTTLTVANTGHSTRVLQCLLAITFTCSVLQQRHCRNSTSVKSTHLCYMRSQCALVYKSFQ
jgi:hypothetical protein